MTSCPFSKSTVAISYHSSSAGGGNLMNASVHLLAKDKKIMGRTFYSPDASTFDENTVVNSSSTAQEKVGVL